MDNKQLYLIIAMGILNGLIHYDGSWGKIPVPILTVLSSVLVALAGVAKSPLPPKSEDKS